MAVDTGGGALVSRLGHLSLQASGLLLQGEDLVGSKFARIAASRLARLQLQTYICEGAACFAGRAWHLEVA